MSCNGYSSSYTCLGSLVDIPRTRDDLEGNISASVALERETNKSRKPYYVCACCYEQIHKRPLKKIGEFFQPIRRETTNRPTNQDSKVDCAPEKTINVVEARCGKTCATRRKFGIDSNLLKMTLTKRAWRFSTDLSATLIPLISLISSPGCSVPKIKKTNKLVSFMLGWLSTTSNVFMQAMGRIDALVGFFHSSAFTNLFRVGFSELAPYADRVCWFSTLLRKFFFYPVGRFSSLNSSF